MRSHHTEVLATGSIGVAATVVAGRKMSRGFKKSSLTPRTDPAHSLVIAVLVTTVFFVPLVISRRGLDAFRLPKEIVGNAGAILIIAISAVALLFRTMSWRSWRGPVPRLVTLTFIWMLITTFASSNRVLSALSIVFAGTAAVIGLAAFFNARRLSMKMALLVLWVPAAGNAVFVILQRFQIWNPFNAPSASRLYLTALVGNPNDVGMYLVTPLLIAFAYALQTRSRLTFATAILCGAGIVATQTLTAFVAAFCGVIVLLSRKFQRYGGMVLLATMIVVMPLGAFLSNRASVITTWVKEGNYDRVLSGRLPAFMTAWAMFLDHPFAGVGPGCFGYNYYPYRVAIGRSHPKLALSITQGINFEFVHNDFLEVAAETGAPGLLLLIATLVVFGKPPRPGNESPPEESTTRALAAQLRPALATSIAILMLAQFPLQLASTSVTILYAAGLFMGWSAES